MKQAFPSDSEPQRSLRVLRFENCKKLDGISIVAVLRIKGRVAARCSPSPTWGGEKSEVNPMDRTFETNIGNRAGPVRCGAKTRAGAPCQCPPIKHRKRCRIHGGLSPGAPQGTANGSYRDGYWTREAVEERKFIRSLVKGTLAEKL
jgi:hypothetical protein